ncbi:sugar diacid recognition domain-containing protein [Pseudomonas sp. EL_65y_Pfl2_R95]|uniref:sugar diacid recognition domain-containing protein n=1 Tax=Pseudomonas sp. EL_65y_Pfl2_R95 TaxID=3088698 RepID=UPI0030DDD711
MFELNHELAQDIVDRAMAILPCNVNVMDSQGLILGSGEKDRIDTRHEGAQLVLSNRRIVEIDEQAAQSLKGVQQGINLPLMHDDQLIGVLGLSGNPLELRTFAQLVRMTAEMLVDQSHMQTERQWRRQRCDDLIASLLAENGGSKRQIEEAHQLGLKPNLSRTPYIIEAESEAKADYLQTRYSDSWCTPLSPGTLLWCCPSNVKIELTAFIDRLNAQGWAITRMVAGAPAQDLRRLREGCQHAINLLDYGQTVKPDVTILALGQYRMQAVLWARRDDDVVAALMTPLRGIQAKDSNGQLLQTLRSWCAHNGQPQACADALGIHRNSLRYRLERIAELSGKDVNRLSELVELYLGIELLPVD